jgi:predicted amidophosphoribosyltransferase
MAMPTSSILYHNSSFRHDYLCHYLPVAAGADRLSGSLLRFKRRIQPDLDAWTDCSLEVLRDIPVPPDSIPMSPDTIVLRALGHEETSAGHGFPAALDLLGEKIATRFGCRYLPSLLLKARFTLPCKYLFRRQRLDELRDVYTVAPAPWPKPAATNTLHPVPLASPPFLLIDDILTTGTTMRMIIRALRARFPACPIQIFTLARADYNPAFNQSTPPRGQNYHLETGSGWVVAEEDQGFNSIKTLKGQIFANSF